jgi:hypothetical protein
VFKVLLLQATLLAAAAFSTWQIREDLAPRAKVQDMPAAKVAGGPTAAPAVADDDGPPLVRLKPGAVACSTPGGASCWDVSGQWAEVLQQDGRQAWIAVNGLSGWVPARFLERVKD